MNYPSAEQRSNITIGISMIAPRGGESMSLWLIKPLSAVILADLYAVFMAGLSASGGLKY